jgi:UDP-N-acetylmuramoyl-tripeptide--D-alanyl-D-alanine ligase
MMELLARTPGYRRRILAAGEMLELGPQSAELHRQSGVDSGAQKLDYVIGVQGHAAELVKGAVQGGVAANCTRFFSSSSDAAAFIPDLLRPGDLLLVKGSRGVKMERIVDAVRARFALGSDGVERPASTPGHA